MRTLLLVGGGHTHALYLLNARRLLPDDTRVVLISPERFVPYPGMLPGLVAGHYRFRDCHIDLGQLCRATETELVFGRATHLDPQNRRVTLEDDTTLDFDLVSLNTGLQPDTRTPGIETHALSLKPINRFLPLWQETLEQLHTRDRIDQVNLGVIGNNLTAVEMALALRHRLNRDDRPKAPITVHLVHTGGKLLPDFPLAAQLRTAQLLQERQIRVHPLFQVARVEADQILTERQQHLPMDKVIWCQPGEASQWLASSGLKVNDRGLIQVNPSLQSISHPSVFAAGEIASATAPVQAQTEAQPERQAKVLAANLVRAFEGEPLRTFKPARRALNVLACGDEFALARWGNWVWGGAWVWRWKQRMERKYMAQFPRP